MQLTIDSSQSLNSVLPVIGAIYGVTLVVDGSAGATPSADVAPAPAAKATARKAGRPAKKLAKAATKRPAKKATISATARRSGGVDASVIREWARGNGINVSERGQLPKSILTAYTEAH